MTENTLCPYCGANLAMRDHNPWCKPPTGVIENGNGQLQRATGPDAVAAFALRTLLVGLRTEEKSKGRIRLTRGTSCRARAKQLLGVSTNSYATLIQLIETRLDQKLEKVLIVDRDEEKPEDYK